MKKVSVLFIVICLLICLVPSAGMLFFPTTQTTENRPMASAPQFVTQDGSFNKDFFADFETWFNQRIALRNQMVYADAMVQSHIFGTSNVSGVIRGSDGWLYYASTLDDYLGKDVMNARELANLAHNICIVEDALAAQGVDFVFTVPANKNTLYGDNMPYYASAIVNPDHSAKLLAPYLAAQGVTYLDLFTLFENQDEVLYLARDSHWNNKGACLAYNAVMDTLQLPHEDYQGVQPAVIQSTQGDLNRMLYSFWGKAEENYDYALQGNYAYADAGADVTDGWIVTQNENGTGTLLMFRDSFADTLIPFFSSAFETAYYSKGQPHSLESFVQLYAPDVVVMEKVERNIDDYLENPPILSAPLGDLPQNLTIAQTDSTLQVESCMYDVNYYCIYGTADAQQFTDDAELLVSVNGTAYRAYHCGEHDFMLYLKKDLFDAAAADVQLYAVTDDACTQLLSLQVELPQ